MSTVDARNCHDQLPLDDVGIPLAQPGQLFEASAQLSELLIGCPGHFLS
jgi:hypothetical protein